MSTTASVIVSTPAGQSQRKQRAGVVIAGIIFAFLLTAAIVPQLFSAADPEYAALDAVFLPPSSEHPFGTDHLGRDVWARTVYGASYSLAIGVGAAAISLIAGSLLGLFAVYLPFGLDRVIQRLIDILLAFPDLLLALIIIAVLGRGPVNTLIAVGLSGIAVYARLVRSQVLSARLSGYAEQAKIIGESPLRVILSHVLPNISRPVAVLATLSVASSILAVSSLSFLGLGVAPPTPEWGAILSESRSYLNHAPWASAFPATAVAISVISITVLGRSLQSRLSQGGGR